MIIKVTDIVWDTEDPKALAQLRTEPFVINTRKIPKGQSLENYIWESCDCGEYEIDFEPSCSNPYLITNMPGGEYDFEIRIASIVSFSTSHSMELTKEYYLEKLDRLRYDILTKIKEPIFAMKCAIKRKLVAMKKVVN